jgi:hypothetical protein
MGLTVHFEVLNQLGTPMMYSATLANRPAAGITGRIFFRTDSPYGIFRDTGSAWDQISGASTFSGSFATGQVAFGSATDTIAGTNNLFWDNANARLGVGTNTPQYKIDNTGTLRTSNVTVNSSGQGIITLFENANSYVNIDYSGGIGAGNFRIQRFISGSASGEISLSNGASFLWTGSSSMYINNSAQIGNGTGLEINFRNRAGINYAPIARDSMLTVKGNNVGNNANILTTLTDTSVQALNVFSTGNVGINANNVDAGQKLQVIGDSLLKGSGNTGATTGLTIQNSDAVNLFRVNNSGYYLLSGSNGMFFSMFTTSPGAVSINGTNTQFYNYTTTQSATAGAFLFTGDNFTQTTGDSIGVYITKGFAPTSGSATFNALTIKPPITQSGGANGITRSLYLDATVSGVSAPNYRALEWTNNSGFGLYGAGTAANYLGGSLGIKTTAIYTPSTFSLDVNGGLLIKNTAGTTAQITLINADPSVGGNNGFLVNTVGGTSGSSYVDLQGYYGTSITGSTALRLNPAGGPVIVNSTTNSGEQVQITGSLRVNGQLSPTIGTLSGQHLIINCDGTLYKINLFNP